MANDFHEVVLAGPSKNALSSAAIRGLGEQLAAAQGRPVLLRGEGGVFSSGLDLAEVAGLDTEAKAWEFLQLFERVIVAWATHPAPVVACVNGHAIAGGCVLALCADWRVAETNPRTRIGLNEVALGVEFPPHTLELVAARLTPAARQAVLLGAGLMTVEDALRYGLVDELAPDALAAATAKLAVLAAHPRGAYAATKRALLPTLSAPADQERLLRERLAAWTAPALRARVAAVLTKGASGR